MMMMMMMTDARTKEQDCGLKKEESTIYLIKNLYFIQALFHR
jgi:hypothetical protein